MSAPRPSYTTAESWLLGRVGETPQTSLGWFRAGVGFYNKREFQFSIECFQRSVQLDPLNVRREKTEHQQDESQAILNLS